MSNSRGLCDTGSFCWEKICDRGCKCIPGFWLWLGISWLIHNPYLARDYPWLSNRRVELSPSMSASSGSTEVSQKADEISREKIPWQKPSELQPSKFICDGLKQTGQHQSLWVCSHLFSSIWQEFASFGHFWGLRRWDYWILLIYMQHGRIQSES